MNRSKYQGEMTTIEEVSCDADDSIVGYYRYSVNPNEFPIISDTASSSSSRS